MHDHIRSVARLMAAWCGLGFLVGFILSWGGVAAFVLGLFIVPLLALFMFGLALSLSIRGISIARKSNETTIDRVITSLAAPVLAGIAIFASLPLLWTGSWLGTLSKLTLHQRHYRSIITAEAARNDVADTGDQQVSGGTTYVVDRGPPVRIAFDPDGLLDNWNGIIYDPTGRVMLAHGFDAAGRFYGPDDVTKLFGGDLVSCRPLFASFYDCSFT